MTGPHDGGRTPDDGDTQEIPVIGADDSATVPHIPQAPPPAPPAQPSWLDFDDDDDEDDDLGSVFDTTGGDADATVVAARPRSSGYTSLPPEAFTPNTATAPKKRKLAIIVAAAVVVLAAVIGGSVLLFAGGDEPGEAVAESGPTDSQSEPAGDVDCPSATIGNVTTGRDAGSQDSGVEVIKAFNHAYYVDRDARAAAAFIHPTGLDKIIPSIDGLQKFLDEMPADTTYCLAITDQGEGQFRNEITETAPDGKVSPYYQRIQTGEENGRWFILSNTPLDN